MKKEGKSQFVKDRRQEGKNNERIKNKDEEYESKGLITEE